MISLVDLISSAKKASLWSKDPHTQLGAAIVKSDGTVLVTACNTFPDGVAETPERLERPEKYKFIEHAERNVIYSAAREGIALAQTAMVFGHNPIPCGDCARAIIQSGIVVVIGIDMPQKASSKWDDSCSLGEQLLTEAGVCIVFVNVVGGKVNRVIGTLPDNWSDLLSPNQPTALNE